MQRRTQVSLQISLSTAWALHPDLNPQSCNPIKTIMLSKCNWWQMTDM